MEALLEGLPLTRATDPSWAEAVASSVDHVLADHAHCELKAASTAISLCGRYSDDDLLAQDMLALAREEMRHFASVRDLLVSRGAKLPPVGPDRYVKELRMRAQRGLARTEVGLDALLICCFVEA
ncbi:MAG: tRNA isopentenyl-2-thiomethyl-A-37 hydroxylase MiaE, partial [Planctomycetota bacterium]